MGQGAMSNAISGAMNQVRAERAMGGGASLDGRGIVGRLLAWIQPRARSEARLTVLDRITLAPRQSLALIEAEGRRLLVATSPDAAPTFYALDGPPSPASRAPESRAGRVSC